MKILIYGGSFNPPHKGHRDAAAFAAQKLKADKLLIIPDCQPPHKEMERGAPSPEQRLEMCRLAFAGVRGALVSDIEIRRGGKSYTSDTLRALREKYPDAELWLLVGFDMFRTLHEWHEAGYILATAKIGAFPRTGG